MSRSLRHPGLWIIAALALASAGCGDSETEGCMSNKDCPAGQACLSGACTMGLTSKGCRNDEQCDVPAEWCDPVDMRCKPREDAGEPAAHDAGGEDTGSSPDLGVSTPKDAGPGDTGSAEADAGPPPADAGAADAGPPPPDAGPRDAGTTPDAGTPDAGRPDAGRPDTGTPDAGPAPDAGPPGCTLDSDCTRTNPDHICIAPRCVTRCDRPGGAACGGGQICNPNSGRCIPGNQPLGATCNLDQQCASTFCLELTMGTSAESVCTTPCGASANCPLGFSCGYVSGMSFCLGESLFGANASFDTPAGGTCSSSNISCQSGWCNTADMECLENCSRESHCSAFGGNCWTYEQSDGSGGNTYDHLCRTETGAAAGGTCAANSACTSGICNRYDDKCASHCCADADCPAGQSCSIYDLDPTGGTIVKICAARAATSGTLALGASCTQASECESEVCLPRDPTSTNGARRCSTLCCTDADCNALPLGGKCRPFGGPDVNGTSTIVGGCVPN